jgi:hypothetical protein
MTALTIVTRKAAHAAGLTHFYTGRPCGRGHDAPRFVSTGNCVQCGRENAASFRKDLQRNYVARLRGQFAYSLHPDDHAAALAFCQALDMARGVAPSLAPAQPVRTPRTLEQLEQDRRDRLGLVDEMTRPAVDPLAHGWR